MMKLGFSTNAFTCRTIYSAINTISKIGFDGIELVVDQPHAFNLIIISLSLQISSI